jgi:hypothetical protein
LLAKSTILPFPPWYAIFKSSNDPNFLVLIPESQQIVSKELLPEASFLPQRSGRQHFIRNYVILLSKVRNRAKIHSSGSPPHIGSCSHNLLALQPALPG